MDNKPQAAGQEAPGEASLNASLPPANDATAASPLTPWRRFLHGPDGILVLPRWLIYLALAWLVFQIERWVLASSKLTGLEWRFVVEACMMGAVILPGVLMAVIEKQPFGAFGLPARTAFGKNFWVGALWGIASLSALMFALYFGGAFRFGGLILQGARLWKFAAYYAVFFLITGFFEDFLLRGYSLWVLSRGIGFWPAAAFLSFTFGYIHGRNPGETTTGLVAAGLIGFFLCLTVRRTGDLWWAIGFHMAWDWGESYLYSVPDSGALLPGHLLSSGFRGPDWLTGGTVGPEGSYLVFVLVAALWIVFDRVYPRERS